MKLDVTPPKHVHITRVNSNVADANQNACQLLIDVTGMMIVVMVVTKKTVIVFANKTLLVGLHANA